MNTTALFSFSGSTFFKRRGKVIRRDSQSAQRTTRGKKNLVSEYSYATREYEYELGKNDAESNNKLIR